MGADEEQCLVHKDDEPNNQNPSNCLGFLILLGFCSFFAFIFVFLPITIDKNTTGPEPELTLQGVKIYAFNLSTATATLASHLQITLLVRNSYHLAGSGIYFDETHVYASYKNQQITLPATVPPMYLDHPDVTSWSPYLTGTTVPVDPNRATSLAQDVDAGAVLINVKVKGWLRTEKRSFMYRYMVRYRMEVRCPTYVTFGKRKDDGVIGWDVKTPFVRGCNVEVFM